MIIILEILIITINITILIIIINSVYLERKAKIKEMLLLKSVIVLKINLIPFKLEYDILKV